MRDAKLWLSKKNRQLLAGGAGVGWLRLLLFLGFLGGAIGRLVLCEKADGSREERQAEHQCHEFLHFDLLEVSEAIWVTSATIISATDEDSLKGLLKTFHLS
jgi:hypothetical protein